MNKILRYLLVFIYLLSGIQSFAAVIPSVFASAWFRDSLEINVRMPEKEVLNKYYSSKNFKYQRTLATTGGSGLWFRIWNFVGNFLERVKGFLDFIPFLLYFLLAGLMLLFLYILISKTKLYKIIYSQKEIRQIPFKESDSDESDIDINRQIEIEIQNQNYRKAIRFMFIKLLNQLETKNLIVYSKGKTNLDYQSELTGSSLFNDFRKSVVIYEYVWYGNFQIDSHGFEYLSGRFNNLFKQLDE